MHHKFAVFCDIKKQMQADDERFRSPDARERLVPKAVWTGSYNWTESAERNLENALFIEDVDVANKFLEEWSNVASISEPLNWEHKYVTPEWRVGS